MGDMEKALELSLNVQETMAETIAAKSRQKPSVDGQEVKAVTSFLEEIKSGASTVDSAPSLIFGASNTAQCGLPYVSFLSGAGTTARNDHTVFGATKRASHSGVPAAIPTNSGVRFTVWYGTNRISDSAKTEVKFTNERASDLSFGKVEVQILKYHDVPGKKEPSWYEKVLRWNFSKDIAARKITPRKRDVFFEEIRKDMGEKDSLVFIHGYNVKFEAAAERAAQLGFDLKVPGVTAFFSWPAAADDKWWDVMGLSGLVKYTVDEATIEASERHMAEFLIELSKLSGEGKLHIIAHSMGNRGLLRALQRIQMDDSTTVKFGQIIFAAPDVDVDVFKNIASEYFATPSRLANRFTLYSSNKDKAVGTSEILHHYPRAGTWKPFTIAPQVENIASSVTTDFLGHSYFAEAYVILADIKRLIDDNESETKPHERTNTMLRSNQDSTTYHISECKQEGEVLKGVWELST